MKIISIYSPKGGVGKSTLTVNLAGAYAAQGLKVVVVDTDEQETVYQLFSQAKKPTFDVMTSFPAKANHDVMLIDHHPSHSKVPFGSFIVCPIEPCPISLLSYEKARDLLRDKKHMLVVNNMDKRRKYQRDFVIALKGSTYKPAQIIPYLPAFTMTMGQSKTVFDVRWGYEARKARKHIQTLRENIA